MYLCVRGWREKAKTRALSPHVEYTYLCTSFFRGHTYACAFNALFAVAPLTAPPPGSASINKIYYSSVPLFIYLFIISTGVKGKDIFFNTSISPPRPPARLFVIVSSEIFSIIIILTQIEVFASVHRFRNVTLLTAYLLRRSVTYII